MSINTNYEKMCRWEIEKAVFLQKVAMDNLTRAIISQREEEETPKK